MADECGPANQTACPQGEVARVGKGADRASGQATDPYMIVGSKAQLRVFRISRFEEVIYVPICSTFMGDGTAVGAGNESAGALWEGGHEVFTPARTGVGDGATYCLQQVDL